MKLNELLYIISTLFFIYGVAYGLIEVVFYSNVSNQAFITSCCGAIAMLSLRKGGLR